MMKNFNRIFLIGVICLNITIGDLALKCIQTATLA